MASNRTSGAAALERTNAVSGASDSRSPARLTTRMARRRASTFEDRPRSVRSAANAAGEGLIRAASMAATWISASGAATSAASAWSILSVSSQATVCRGGPPCDGRVPHQRPSQGGALRATPAAARMASIRCGSSGRQWAGVESPADPARRNSNPTARGWYTPSRARMTAATRSGECSASSSVPTASQSPIRRKATRALKAT